MRTEEMILEEYRKGGVYERLNLYIQYRDLRGRFSQIDSDASRLPEDDNLRHKPAGNAVFKITREFWIAR